MKAITIREPYASLIVNNLKEYETRSWKTNYRGKLYIHAGISKDKIKNDDILKLIKDNNINFKYGYIIGVCNLVDCIKITPEFKSSLSKRELLVGDYTLGRYAWKLKDVKLIKPISYKGKLSIWNFDMEDKNE